MNIRKLPSGSYNVRKMIDGHTYSLTFEHKPTKKEIEYALYAEIKDNPHISKGTFKEYAEDYIRIKSEVLSPSTINAYRSIIRNLSAPFLTLQLASITQVNVQREINTYAINRSPKSVKNASGFITAVLWTYRPDMAIHTKLPQKQKVETYIPTDKEVEKLLQTIKGSPYEAVILLTIFGLRKSEAIAVIAEDIEGNILTINKSMVINEKGEYVLKSTKTESSTRKIWIPTELVELIKKQGKAYEGFPGNILRYLHRTQDALGINRCKLHALRHYYVSMSHTIGIPDAYIAEAVGHASTNTTRNIYMHAQSDKQIEMEIKAAAAIMSKRILE